MTSKQLKYQHAFKNIVEFFTTLEFEVLTLSDEFYNTNKLTYRCRDNHTITLGRQSFNNKRDLYKKEPHQFCSKCKRYDELVENKKHRVIEIKKIIEPYGHKLLSINDDLKQMEMECGNCGSIGTTNFGTLSRSTYTGLCVRCQNNKRRISFEKVKITVEMYGFTLMMKDTDYTSNKQIRIGCSICDLSYKSVNLHDLKRRFVKHYHCSNCGDGVSGKFVKLVPDTTLCHRCYCYKNPNVDIPFRFKLKEHVFVESFKEFMKSLPAETDFEPPVFDKQISQSCSKRRPDILIDCYTHSIVLELDENQHSGYNCETKRLCEIYQDLGNRPIVFLRLNPDSYKDDKGSHKSCFGWTKTGTIKIYKKEWESRYLTVFNSMIYYMSNVPTKSMTTKQFFYSQ